MHFGDTTQPITPPEPRGEWALEGGYREQTSEGSLGRGSLAEQRSGGLAEWSLLIMSVAQANEPGGQGLPRGNDQAGQAGKMSHAAR